MTTTTVTELHICLANYKRRGMGALLTTYERQALSPRKKNVNIFYAGFISYVYGIPILKSNIQARATFLFTQASVSSRRSDIVMNQFIPYTAWCT